MKHLALISEFVKVANTHRWDNLYELLAPDFHFKSILTDIKGRTNYINFEKARSLPIEVKTMSLQENNDKSEYLHIFTLNYEGKSPLSFVTHERIGVSCGLISYSYLSIADTAPKLDYNALLSINAEH